MRYRPGLAAKMVFAITLVSVVTAFVSYRASSRLTTEVLHDLEVQRATNMRAAINEEIRSVIARLTVPARLLSMNPQLLAAAADDAPFAVRRERLRPLLDRHYVASGVEILEVVNHDGRVLYRAHASDRFGDTRPLAIIAQALTGKEALATAHRPVGPRHPIGGAARRGCKHTRGTFVGNST